MFKKWIFRKFFQEETEALCKLENDLMLNEVRYMIEEAHASGTGITVHCHPSFGRELIGLEILETEEEESDEKNIH